MSRVLVLDDDAQIVELLGRALEADGHEVVGATEASQALALFLQQPAELIITDILMPDQDGLAVIREIRREFPGVKIIAMSGGGLIGPDLYLEVAKKLGADQIFEKPLRPTEIRQAVRDLLAAPEGRPAA